jgi:uncharacterized protein YcfJ
MNRTLNFALSCFTLAFAAQASAQISFYEDEDFGGRSFSTERQVGNFNRFGFNDRASSVVVTRNRWEVCDDANFRGRCVVLRQGQYRSLTAMGLNDRISSVRMLGDRVQVDEARYAPPPIVEADYRRRNKERLFEARVTEVRAVLGTPERRCWVEREQVRGERGEPNVPGALVGAVLGGILGHQIGGIATPAGAVVGGVVGANVGREGRGPGYSQNVERCATTPASSRPEYWDVTYEFRGQDHRVQMTTAPGATVTVNRDGEPRS